MQELNYIKYRCRVNFGYHHADSSSDIIGRSEWIRVLSRFGISILYLICFYALSIMISTLVHRPAIAMMILLQIWVFLIIIYPNLGVIIAEKLYKLPTEQEIVQQKIAAFQPYDDEHKKNWERSRMPSSAEEGLQTKFIENILNYRPKEQNSIIRLIWNSAMI